MTVLPTEVRRDWVGRRAPLLAVAAAAIGLLSGCSGSVGLGPQVVDRATVEHNVAHQLASELHQPVPTVTCPGDLPAKLRAHIQCVLVAQGSTTRYAVTVTVNSLSGGTAHFTAQVADQPLG